MFAKLVNLFRRTKPGYSRVEVRLDPFEDFVARSCTRKGVTRDEFFVLWGGSETRAREMFWVLENAGVERVRAALLAAPQDDEFVLIPCDRPTQLH